jgi:hypothetical protein
MEWFAWHHVLIGFGAVGVLILILWLTTRVVQRLIKAEFAAAPKPLTSDAVTSAVQQAITLHEKVEQAQYDGVKMMIVEQHQRLLMEVEQSRKLSVQVAHAYDTIRKDLEQMNMRLGKLEKSG